MAETDVAEATLIELERLHAAGRKEEARRLAHRHRAVLLSPSFVARVAKRSGAAAADAMRDMAALAVSDWLCQHAPVSDLPQGKVLEDFRLAAERTAELWSGAVRLRLPQRYVAERGPPTAYTCHEPGIAGPTIEVAAEDLGPTRGRSEAALLASIERDLEYLGEAFAAHPLGGPASPGLFAQYEMLAGEDWLVCRRWLLLRIARGRAWLVTVSLIVPVFLDRRSDIRVFVRRFERALGEIEIDADALGGAPAPEARVQPVAAGDWSAVDRMVEAGRLEDAVAAFVALAARMERPSHAECEAIREIAVGLANLGTDRHDPRPLLPAAPAIAALARRHGGDALGIGHAAIFASIAGGYADQKDLEGVRRHAWPIADIRVSSRAARQRDAVFGRALSEVVRMELDGGSVETGRRIAFERRALLLAPWFDDEALAMSGPVAAANIRQFVSEGVAGWLIHHARPEDWPDGGVLARYAIEPAHEVALWDGAVHLRVPRAFQMFSSQPGEYEFYQPGTGAPTILVHAMDLAPLHRLADDAMLERLATVARAGLDDAYRFTAERRERTCLFTSFEEEDRGDWLVYRRWYKLLRLPQTVRALVVSLNIPVFLDAREDMQALVALLERSVADCRVDPAGLPRSSFT